MVQQVSPNFLLKISLKILFWSTKILVESPKWYFGRCESILTSNKYSSSPQILKCLSVVGEHNLHWTAFGNVVNMCYPGKIIKIDISVNLVVEYRLKVSILCGLIVIQNEFISFTHFIYGTVDFK